MIPAVGQRVGPYEILGRLGSGGMGLVFSAWDSRLQRDVAIKLLREEFSARDMRERFLQEARAASGLNHPNICTVFDIGDQDGDPYLVMELLKGETLRARIFSGPASPEDILQIGTEIADALAAAHARGVIHRDIKPANIFLVAKPGNRWQAKVLDFGLAKVDLGDGLDARFHITGAGATVGTVSYMSPEQARGEMLDARSDLFALGIVLYEMATGQVPFHGATSALVFVQLLSHPPEPVRELNPSIPKDLERIIVKLLAKDRTARFQSAAEVVDALHQVSLKKGSTGKHPLLSLPTWGRGANPVAIPKQAPPPPPSPKIADKARLPLAPPVSPAAPQAPPAAGNSVIRPVRRVVTEVLSPPLASPLPPPPPSPQLTATPPEDHPASPDLALIDLPAVPPEAAPSPILVQPPVVPVATTPTAKATPEKPHSKPPKPFSSRPTSFDYVADVHEDARDPAAQSTRKHSRWLIAAGVLGAAGLAFAIVHWTGQHAAPAAARPGKLMLAHISNHTGDKMLDGVVLEGLRLDLAQSQRVTVLDNTEVVASMHNSGVIGTEPLTNADAQIVANDAGATSFLVGDIRTVSGNIQSSYTVYISVYNSANLAPIAHGEETAVSRGQIADAIDRLAAEIRAGLGESGDETTKTSVPLAQEATSNVEALQSLVDGNAAAVSGHPLEALTSLQHAVAVEPQFTQAYLRLAELYHQQHAEIAAADAATHARDSSARASDRTRALAAATYEIYATADYPHALGLLDTAAASYPRDVAIAGAKAYTLRLMGKYAESVEASQVALTESPYDLHASAQGELSMLAIDRDSSRAAHLESDIGRSGQHHASLPLLVAFLNEKPGGSYGPSLAELTSDKPLVLATRSAILDTTGRLGAGLESWRSVVQIVKLNPSLASGASWALAQAALDRAVTSNCGVATSLAREASAGPMGQQTIFAVGMAQGLCGDAAGTRKAEALLQSRYPQSFPARNFYLADLTALQQMDAGDPTRALATLQTAKMFDLLSLTAYLRGRAHDAAKQWPFAIADFQFILRQRGATTLTNAPIYPMAQLGLARAYARSGDVKNGAAAYRTFIDMWQGGPGDPLVAEAQSHLK